MRIGEIIKKYRTDQGVSMEKFAELCGRSKGYISMLERGVNPVNGKPITPGIDTFARIAAVMHVSADELLHMTGGKPRAAIYGGVAAEGGDADTGVGSCNVSESSGEYIAGGETTPETIRAYYDGHAFIPIKPVSVSKNQPVVVTILDESAMTPADMARHAATQLKGILSGSGMSSETFAARKQLEKELEK